MFSNFLSFLIYWLVKKITVRRFLFIKISQLDYYIFYVMILPEELIHWIKLIFDPDNLANILCDFLYVVIYRVN